MPTKLETPQTKQKPQYGAPTRYQFNPNNVYGNVPFKLPIYPAADVDAVAIGSVLPDNSPAWPLWDDAFEQDLANQGGLAGLGYTQIPAVKLSKNAPADKPQTVDVPLTQPLSTSTIYGVVGVATVAIIGSIALWAHYKGKAK